MRIPDCVIDAIKVPSKGWRKGGVEAPWSPNLLPSAPPSAEVPSFADMLSGAEIVEPGIPEAAEDDAKRRIVSKADKWLRANWGNPEAWINVI